MSRLIKARQVKAVADYLLTPSPSLYYVGWVGYSNLGDEAIREGARQAFAPLRMAWMPPRSTAWKQQLVGWKRHSGIILGGGTQIGESSPLTWFRDGLDKYGNGIVYGVGVSPVEGEDTPEWLVEWSKVLGRCEYVGVRGEDSARTLARVGIQAEVVGDTACVLAKSGGYWSPRPRTLGINIGTGEGHVYDGEENVVDNVAGFVREMTQNGWSVEFFCVWPPDLDVVRETARRSGITNPVIHAEYHDADRYLERVKSMSVFVGMKLHSVVLAMCAGVPAIMMEYRPKCREFMESAGMGRYNIRTDELSPRKLAELAVNLAEQGSNYSETIVAALGAQRERLMERSGQLRRTLGFQ